jgi:hypothetical protein
MKSFILFRVAGLRLAKFLNEAFSSHDCPVR